MATDAIDPARLDAFLSDPQVPQADKDEVARQLRAAQFAAPAQTGPQGTEPPATETPTATAGRDWKRLAAQGVGGVLGALPGAVTMDPVLAAAGGAGGIGLAGTAADILEGKTDWRRGAVQALGVAGAQAMLPEATIPMAIARSGLASGIAGQLYDAARNFWTGKRTTLKGTAKDVAGDVLAGGAGEALAQTLGPRAAARQARRDEDLAAVAARRAEYEQAGITPRASELTGGSTIAQGLEDRPRGTLTGGEMVRRFDVNREAEARAAVEGRLGAISPTGVTDEEWAGNIAKSAIVKSRDAARQQWGQAFDATEAITGDEPVVPVTNLVQQAAGTLRLSRLTPAGAPSGTAKMAALGDEAKALTSAAKQLRDLGLDDEAQAMEDAATSAGKIPFWLARRIESQLGYLGFHGRPPVGATPQQQQAGRLYQAMLSDLDAFYDTDVGQGVRPELDAAKQQFKAGMALYNNSKLRGFFRDTTDPEQAVRVALKPGNITATRDLQQALPPDTYDEVVQGWLHGLYDKHAVGKDFDAAGFARDLRAYDAKGQLDVMLGPEKADEMRQVMAVLSPSRSIIARSSGTSERAWRYAEVGGPFVMLRELLAGHPVAAAGIGATLYGAPYVAGKLTTTTPGIDLLVRTLSTRPPLTDAARTLTSQLAAPGLLP